MVQSGWPCGFKGTLTQFIFRQQCQTTLQQELQRSVSQQLQEVFFSHINNKHKKTITRLL